MSPEDVKKLMQGLKEHVNVSYESEAGIAADLGVSWDASSGWLRGKSKPTFESLLKVRDFLSHQNQGGGGIVPADTGEQSGWPAGKERTETRRSAFRFELAGLGLARRRFFRRLPKEICQG
jgi:hypothetical protein